MTVPVIVMALLSLPAPIAAQDHPVSVKALRLGVTPAWARLPEPVARVRFATGAVEPASAASRKRSNAPVVGGAVLGAIAGFLGGNYIQRSVCEFDCGPGGFTWGFTAMGAAGGATIGWLLRR